MKMSQDRIDKTTGGQYLADVNGMRCELFRENPGGWWDDMIKEADLVAPTVLVTSIFSRYMSEMIGAVPWFLVVRNPEGATAGLLSAFSEYPLNRTTHCWRSGLVLAACGHAIFPVLSWPCTPVILEPDRESDIHAAFASGVVAIQRDSGIASVRNGSIAWGSPEISDQVLRSWDSAGFSLTHRATFRIDLTQSLEERLRSFHRSVRKNIRKCEQSQVRVDRVDAPGNPTIDDYNRMRLRYKKVFSVGARSAAVQDYMWKHLHYDADCFEYFVASRGDNVLAGIGVLHFAGYALEIEAWTTPYALENSLPGGDALKWAIIQWGKERGLRWYDLGGVAVDPADGSKEANILRFKEKWGGTYVEYGLVSRSTSSMRGAAHELARKTWQRWRR